MKISLGTSLVCNIETNPWDCCSSSNPCRENEGDCDNDDECLGHLKCGDGNHREDNCNATFKSGADCCYDPNNVEATTVNPSE